MAFHRNLPNFNPYSFIVPPAPPMAVTSVASSGVGIIATPDPITSTGTISSRAWGCNLVLNNDVVVANDNPILSWHALWADSSISPTEVNTGAIVAPQSGVFLISAGMECDHPSSALLPAINGTQNVCLWRASTLNQLHAPPPPAGGVANGSILVQLNMGDVVTLTIKCGGVPSVTVYQAAEGLPIYSTYFSLLYVGEAI